MARRRHKTVTIDALAKQENVTTGNLAKFFENVQDDRTEKPELAIKRGEPYLVTRAKYKTKVLEMQLKGNKDEDNTEDIQ